MMEKEFHITKNLSNLRLDQALSHFVESRSQAAALILKGHVRLSSKKDQKLKPSYRVQTGEVILINQIQEESQDEKEIKPYDFPVPIIYEDEDILVVDKPAGLVVHQGCGHKNDTLINALVHKLNLNVGSDSKRAGLMHRLDKEVSGLLVLSKTHQAQNFLSKQFLKKNVIRKYIALGYGPLLFEEGKIQTLITRHPMDRKKFMISKDKGKEATTRFKLIQKMGDSGLLLFKCQLLTGRTHQVRLHSHEFCGGLVGDRVYTSSKRIKNVKDDHLVSMIQKLNRIALHAAYLSFIHPRTKKQMEFKSTYPKELQSILDYIQKELKDVSSS